MNVLKTQAVLARIYTDAAFRQRFLSNPLAAGEEMGLLPQDARQIAQLSSGQVRFFAHSLVRKRLREVRKLLPLTAGAFGRRFDQLFEQYAATHGLKMPKPHQQDGIGFAAYLRQAMLSAGREPKWAAELARYEAAWLEASDPRRRLTVRLLRCPVALLAERAVRLQEAPRPARQATLAIWFRLRRSAPLRHLLLPLSPGSLLARFRPVLPRPILSGTQPEDGELLQASVGDGPPAASAAEHSRPKTETKLPSCSLYGGPQCGKDLRGWPRAWRGKVGSGSQTRPRSRGLFPGLTATAQDWERRQRA